MLDTWQNIVIALLVVSAALFFRWLLERFWPTVKRRAHNDIIGWQLGILGTTYAVILGFMLYTVWTNFELAEVNADSEANAIVNVYRLADGLPEQQREQLRRSARNYVDTVLEKDWPAMAQNRTSEPLESSQINQQLWKILMSVKAAEPTESTAEDHALYELSVVAEHRRIRLLQSDSRLPEILWWVLIFGGIVTIVSCCMFGATNEWLHGIQVFAFSLLVALVLLAIADIDRPFQGSVHVGDAAFRRAQETMKD
jgi:hypothetical protein